MFEQYIHSPVNDPDLADKKRAWLRAHPTWMIDAGYVESVLDPMEWDRKALNEFPGPFWLHVKRVDKNLPSWLSELSGLVGVRLSDDDIGDTAFTRLIKSAFRLRHLEIVGSTRLTCSGLCSIVDLAHFESLDIYCREDRTFDVAFLAQLSGDKSPLFLNINGYKELSDTELTYISRWNRLTACSLSLASDVRTDFPWLADLKNLRCLQLDGNGPLKRNGLARLAELPELRELKLDFDSCDAAGLDALAKLEKLEELSLYVKGDRTADSHVICNELARIKGIRSLDIRASYGDSSRFNVTTNDLVNFASMPRLEKLTLGGNSEIVPDFSALARALHLKELYHPCMNHPTDYVLNGIAKITGLTRLDMWVDDCTSQGLAALAALPNLTELELLGFEKQDESFLACLADFPALTNLALSFNGNSNLKIHGFSSLKNIKKLTSLVIDERGEWNEAMVDDIVAAKGIKKLLFHALWDLPGVWLKKLKQLPELEEITLNHCLDFQDEDLAFLAEIKTLRRLRLFNSDLITIKGLLRLRHLPLEEINVSGLRHIGGASAQECMALRLAWPEAIIW